MFGRVKRLLLLAFRVAAHNRFRARAFDLKKAREQEAEAKRTPRRRRRRGTYADLPLNPPASTTKVRQDGHDPP